ncbi:MAG: LTA synthase family protein [Lachnospiraceae bacterium]|nr:LTA synthase family protein [Lachnospiraceae bacterium]
MKNKNSGKTYIRILNRLSLLLHAAGSLVLYFLIEAASRHSFPETWEFMTERPLVFLYNALLIFTTSTIVYLFRRRSLMRILIFGLWGVLGAINGIVLANRVTPFTGPDLKLLDDLKKIIGGYLPVYQVILAGAGIVLALIILVFIWFKAPKYTGPRKLLLDIGLIAGSFAVLAGATNLAISKRVLSTYFGNIAFAYEDYGFPYCLTVTLFDTGISQPNKYTEGFVKSLVSDVEEEEPQNDVNIVFLQLESFFDPATVNFLKLSEDPISNFRQLMEEYSSGYYRVPSVGAGTANTEFESISGMSLRYFGAGEYPYKTILKETTCESIPYDLKEYGYTTHAIHNNEATFYSRNTVYPMLGFDTFTSEEYMTDVSDTTETGWIKDHILTGEIMNCLDSTEGADYIYTVSVQGHGDYPTEETIKDPQITVTGAENKEKNNYSWEYYCQQIYEMDLFVKELTDTLAEYPEKVVLVMYGDHLPTMGLETGDLSNRYLFQTPYVIWDNFGLEKEDMNLSAYQMGAEVLNRLGMHRGTLVNFHQNRQGTKNYQKDLEVLQYDLLYGSLYSLGGTALEPSDMQMGVLPITLETVTQADQSMLLLEGENLTAASAIEVNGKVPEQNRLLFAGAVIISGVKLEEGDEAALVQLSASSSEKVLSTSETFTWNGEDSQQVMLTEMTDASVETEEDSDSEESILSRLLNRSAEEE